MERRVVLGGVWVVGEEVGDGGGGVVVGQVVHCENHGAVEWYAEVFAEEELASLGGGVIEWSDFCSIVEADGGLHATAGGVGLCGVEFAG